MGLFGAIGGAISKAVGSIVSSITSGNSGGSPGSSAGGPPSGQPSGGGGTSTSPGKTSSGGSGGSSSGGSSGGGQMGPFKGTYDSSTKTYTDPYGNKSSVPTAPPGSQVVDSGSGKGKIGGSGGSSGGGSGSSGGSTVSGKTSAQVFAKEDVSSVFTQTGKGKIQTQLNSDTEAGRAAIAKSYESQGLDKFGKSKSDYEQTQRIIAQSDINRKVDSYSQNQQGFYQKLVNEGKITPEKANEGYSKAVGTYANTLIEQENQRQGIKKIYQSPMSAFYDPLTGGVVEQSMPESAAKERGYVPISIVGETTKGGKIVESKTGLLTSEQLKAKEFYEKIQQKTQALPTSFVLGGEQEKPLFSSLMERKTAYELAAESHPYSEETLKSIENVRIGKKNEQNIKENTANLGNNTVKFNTSGVNLNNSQGLANRGNNVSNWGYLFTLSHLNRPMDISNSGSIDSLKNIPSNLFSFYTKKKEEAWNWLGKNTPKSEFPILSAMGVRVQPTRAQVAKGGSLLEKKYENPTNLGEVGLLELGRLFSSYPQTIGQAAMIAAEIYGGVKLAGFAASKLPKTFKVVNVGFTAWNVKEGLNTKNTYAQRVESFAFAGLTIAPLALKGVTKAGDIVRTRGMTKAEMPSIESKAFYRKTPAGEVQAVFMRRYSGFKITQPKSWIEAAQGYKPGQFTKRQYRFIAPEVQASYEGKPGTMFPFANPKEHFSFFTGKNIKEYGVPLRSKLPSNVRVKKGFGFSATGEQWKTTEIGEAGQYYSGKGVSIRFLRIDNKYSNAPGAGKMGKKPIVYAGYFSEVKVNPGFEVKIPNPYETNGKPIKKYIFKNPTGQGVLNLPVHKQEVEGVVFGQRVPVRKQFYFNLGGRRVPIEEQAFVDDFSSSQLNKFAKGKTVSGPQYSVYPSMPKQSSAQVFASSFLSISKNSRNSKFSMPSRTSISQYYSQQSYNSSFSSFASSSFPISRASSPASSSPRKSRVSISYSSISNIPNIRTRSSSYPTLNPSVPPIEFRKGKRNARTRDYEYAPSLTAVLFNIQAPAKGFKTKKSYSGMEIRPLLNFGERR